MSDDELQEIEVQCPACSAVQSMPECYMGRLGGATWCRCRYCGMVFDPDPPTDEDDQTATGWAAMAVDEGGEGWDLGAGWCSEREAREELEAQGADMSIVRIYRARTADGWQTWEGE